MNCVIFRNRSEAEGLPTHDYRVKHLLKVLKLSPGDEFAGAVVDRYKGRFRLEAVVDGQARFAIVAKSQESEALAVELAIGYCRPLILKRVFRDATSMGVKAFCVYPTDLGDPSYQQSGYLADGKYEEQFIAGIEQCGDYVLPKLRRESALEPLLTPARPAAPPEPGGAGSVVIALDQLSSAAYQDPNTYHNHSGLVNPVLAEWLAGLSGPMRIRVIVGSERGFSLREKRMLAAASQKGLPGGSLSQAPQPATRHGANAPHAGGAAAPAGGQGTPAVDMKPPAVGLVICRLGPQMVRADTAALAAISSIWQLRSGASPLNPC